TIKKGDRQITGKLSFNRGKPLDQHAADILNLSPPKHKTYEVIIR
ncbi:15698_t:CDS:1, partial [Racocetra persica]